jgi:hypothetical protein
MNNSIVTRRNILLTLVIIVIIIVIGIALDNGIFRLKSTNPSLNNIATSSAEISFTFSQPIKSIGSIEIDGTVIPNTSVKGNTIRIPLATVGIEDGINYSVELTDIHSYWFNATIKNINSVFKARYVEFDKLSNEQQKYQVDNSNSGQVNDPFLDNIFPILKEKYQIEATNVEDGEHVSLYVTFFDEVPDYDNNGAAIQLSNDTAEQYRREVLTTIKDNKGEPDKYQISYSNIYLNTKYGDFKHSHD